MNKYRIEVGPCNGHSGSEAYEGYYKTTGDAVMGVMRSQKEGHPVSSHEQLIAVGDTVDVRVKLLRVNLNRSTSGCKRVQ